MQTTPRSASTIAPASSRFSPVSLSAVTAAVRPTPDEPRPVVETASGATFMTARSSWDLATPGSPTMRTLTSLFVCRLRGAGCIIRERKEREFYPDD
jgi:hypothetical protein